MAKDDEATGDSDESVDVLDESVEDDEGLYEMKESSLSYFGADFDVRGLVQRLESGDIIVPRFDPDESEGASVAGFQRQRVWTKSKMEKFIESLLLGWPVPSIFLVLDEDQRYLVLDGQQRLTALELFFTGYYADGSDFKLLDVAEHLKEATYDTLTIESKRRLNNTFIQATVIEPKGPDGPESVYRLFGRLNSGGISLTPQEVRVALFRGPVVDWIRDLNADPYWRHLYGARSPRLKDHELVLRSLAMENVVARIAGKWSDEALRRDVYKPPMSDCLNSFLSANRDLTGIDTKTLTTAFAATCKLLFEAAGRDGLRFSGRVNAAHVDAVLASLMRLQQQDRLPTKRALVSALNRLRADDDYIEYVTKSTSHRENVYGRLQLAMKTLGKR